MKNFSGLKALVLLLVFLSFGGSTLAQDEPVPVEEQLGPVLEVDIPDEANPDQVTIKPVGDFAHVRIVLDVPVQTEIEVRSQADGNTTSWWDIGIRTYFMRPDGETGEFDTLAVLKGKINRIRMDSCTEDHRTCFPVLRLPEYVNETLSFESETVFEGIINPQLQTPASGAYDAVMRIHLERYSPSAENWLTYNPENGRLAPALGYYDPFIPPNNVLEETENGWTWTNSQQLGSIAVLNHSSENVERVLFIGTDDTDSCVKDLPEGWYIYTTYVLKHSHESEENPRYSSVAINGQCLWAGWPYIVDITVYKPAD